jgi:hypothetical protein
MLTGNNTLYVDTDLIHTSELVCAVWAFELDCRQQNAIKIRIKHHYIYGRKIITKYIFIALYIHGALVTGQKVCLIYQL